MPKFSIIVPVHNVERLIKKCLDSVIAQTFRDWECLCIDDRSEDSSRELVLEYVAKDSRIKLVPRKGRGPGAARNAGMEAAKGEYLVFLDADDSLLSSALQFLSGETADIVTFLHIGWRGIFDSLAGHLLVWNAIYRRETFADLRFPELYNCEDLVYTALAFAKAKTIVEKQPPWYRHRIVKGSLSKTHSWRRVKDTWKSIGLMRKAYRPVARSLWRRLVLARKLTLHFLLHVLLEIPPAIITSARRERKRKMRKLWEPL